MECGPPAKRRKLNEGWEKRRCCITGCTTYSGMGIPLHRFPKEENILWQWIAVTGVKCVSNQTLICGLHFKESDYFNLESAIRHKLKKNTVPSLFLPGIPESFNYVHSDDENDFTEETDPADEICTDCIESDLEKLVNLPGKCSKNVCTQILNQIDEETEYISSICDKLAEEIHKYVSKETQTDPILDDKVKKKMFDASTQTEKFTLTSLLNTDQDLKAFTGINFAVLEALIECIKLVENKTSGDKHLCSLKARVVLTLCKLKLCLSYECLGILFGISKSTAGNYFLETLHLLHAVLEEAVYFPEKDEILQNIPLCFQNFKEVRIVLDCTEVPVESCKCLECRMRMYSHYKGRQTIKILIGTTPSGLISFCSVCYGGKASDKAIFIQSELIHKMIPCQDAIMADKGFLIDQVCEENRIKLIRPPFARKRIQMSTEDSLDNRSIAAARVHVERIMERLKNFSILKSTIDWEMTKYFDKIIIIICGLVNMSKPILDVSRF